MDSADASKRCSRCGEVKPLTEFAKQAGCRDGHRPDCKECRSAYWKAHRAANVERYKARAAARYERQAEALREERRKPCPSCGGDKGEGERRHVCDRCREAIPARKVAEAIAWQKANPEAVARIWSRKAAKRRARRRTQFVEDVHPLVLLEMDDGVCGICGGDVDPLNFHVDHVVPLSKGGEHSYRNTQVAHPVCNSRKGAQIDV